MNELNPCHCGSSAAVVTYVVSGFKVKCEGCRMAAERLPTFDDAVDSWNDLMPVISLQDEYKKAAADMYMTGYGYLVNGKRVDPQDILILRMSQTGDNDNQPLLGE